MSITLKIKENNNIIKTEKINPADTAAVHIHARGGVNYQLVDDTTKFAPENLTISRTGNDLHVAFDGSNIKQPDLIIEGYYEESGENLLIGQQKDGNYYPYVPESGQRAEVVTMLAKPSNFGQSNSEQALGGESFETPVIDSFNFNWLLFPALAIGGIYAITKLTDDDDDGPNDNSQTNNNSDEVITDEYVNFTDMNIQLENSKDTINITNNFNSGELSTGTNDDTVTIGESFGQVNLSSIINLGADNDTISLGYLTSSGYGTRAIDGGTGTDVLTFTGGNHTNDLLTSNIEVIHIAGSNNEINITIDMLLTDDINTLYINNTGGYNVIDLGNNNQSGDLNVSLDVFTLSKSAITATDSIGDSHVYDVYVAYNAGALETLYIDNSLTVL